jgi:hypothetical protein
MRNVKRLWLSSGGLAVVLISILLIASCSENSITNNDNQRINQDLEAINSVELAKSLGGENPGSAKTEWGTYLIAQTQYGFEISGYALSRTFYLDGKPITIKVPDNAFDKNRWGDRLYIFIRAEKWHTPGGVVYYYDCNPDGVVFNSPLTLIQPYEYSSGSQNLYWKNAPLNSWVVEDVSYLSSGKAYFHIGHFSKYAISD